MDSKKETNLIHKGYYILVALMKNNLNLFQGIILLLSGILLFAVSSQEKSITLKLGESFGGGALIYLSYESFAENSKNNK